jgi:hypothetical protein
MSSLAQAASSLVKVSADLVQASPKPSAVATAMQGVGRLSITPSRDAPGLGGESTERKEQKEPPAKSKHVKPLDSALLKKLLVLDPQTMKALGTDKAFRLTVNVMLNDAAVSSILRKFGGRISKIPEPLKECVIDAAFFVKALNLRDVDIGEIEEGREILTELGEYFKVLEELDLSNSDDIYEEEHLQVINFPHLRKLDFSNCGITTALKELGRLPSLEELVVNEIGDNALFRDIAQSAKSLTHLSAADSEWLTNAGLKHVVNMKALTVLNLTGCKKITPDGVEELLKNRPGLKVII